MLQQCCLHSISLQALVLICQQHIATTCKLLHAASVCIDTCSIFSHFLHAAQGLIALLSNSAFMLALHVILGAMLGAALAAHIEGIFNQQEMK